MRLLNTQTRKFGEFFEEEIPDPYYILSHRWTRDEISYKDYSKGRRLESAGYKKVDDFCKVVQGHHGPSWVWVDTICIDKRSSAELSEAINSMWKWYWNSELCYAYLDDVETSRPNTEAGSFSVEPQVENSKWFTRGWTLQELLAPEQLIFFDQDWEIFGLKRSPTAYHDRYIYRFKSAMTESVPVIVEVLSKVTGIDAEFLCNRASIGEASIACRLSWASKRKTTRKEDEAYCLLGLLDINMPLLYGEGDRAFRRLQEEIVRTCTDQSIFAWDWQPPGYRVGMLSQSPADFKDCNNITKRRRDELLCTLEMTNQGVKVQGRVHHYVLVLKFFRNSDMQQRNTRFVGNHLSKYAKNAKGNIDLVFVPLNCSSNNLEPFGIYLARHVEATNKTFIKFMLSKWIPDSALIGVGDPETNYSTSTTLIVQMSFDISTVNRGHLRHKRRGSGLIRAIWDGID